MDILGFRALVAQQSADKIDEALALFAEHAAPFFGADIDHLSYIAFSDLIVRVSPLEDGESVAELASRVTTEASDLAAAQSQLAQKGVLVRGAITCGDLSIDSGRIFGPALIRAYELESGRATYPRIIIDEEIAAQIGLPAWIDDPDHDYDAVEEYVWELGHYCVRDSDGAIFVDYLGSMLWLDNETPEGAAEGAVLLSKHADLVRAGLRMADERIAEKYSWLRRYHNDRVPEGTPHLLVP